MREDLRQVKRDLIPKSKKKRDVFYGDVKSVLAERIRQHLRISRLPDRDRNELGWNLADLAYYVWSRYKEGKDKINFEEAAKAVAEMRGAPDPHHVTVMTLAINMQQAFRDYGLGSIVKNFITGGMEGVVVNPRGGSTGNPPGASRPSTSRTSGGDQNATLSLMKSYNKGALEQDLRQHLLKYNNSKLKRYNLSEGLGWTLLDLTCWAMALRHQGLPVDFFSGSECLATYLGKRQVASAALAKAANVMQDANQKYHIQEFVNKRYGAYLAAQKKSAAILEASRLPPPRHASPPPTYEPRPQMHPPIKPQSALGPTKGDPYTPPPPHRRAVLSDPAPRPSVSPSPDNPFKFVQGPAGGSEHPPPRPIPLAIPIVGPSIPEHPQEEDSMNRDVEDDEPPVVSTTGRRVGIREPAGKVVPEKLKRALEPRLREHLLNHGNSKLKSYNASDGVGWTLLDLACAAMMQRRTEAKCNIRFKEIARLVAVSKYKDDQVEPWVIEKVARTMAEAYQKYQIDQFVDQRLKRHMALKAKEGRG